MQKHWFGWVIGVMFVLGIILRLNFFIHSNVFEDDECRLLLTILDKNLWSLFGPLGDAQSAPPLFLIPAKILLNLFGFKEQILKLIPFLASLGAVFMFFKLALKMFKHKIAVLASCFLFFFGRNIIEFSVVFKQYSTDILTAILCMYFLPEINFEKLTIKQIIILTVSLIILPFVSLPSTFFVGAFFILNLIKNKNFKPFLYALPFLTIFVLYYFFNLLPSKSSLDMYFPNYWDKGFIGLSAKNLIGVLCFHLKYLFYPNSYTLFTFALFLWGIYLFIKEKSSYGQFILISLALMILASVLGQYPLMGRVALYSAPLFMLIVIKPLDLERKSLIAAFCCFALSFFSYDFSYFKQISNPENSITYSPGKLMSILKEKYKSDEAIICNNASASSFLLYSSAQNFTTPNTYLMDIDKIDEEHTLKYLNNLSRNQKFWFYMVKDYRKTPVYPYFLSWVEGQKILYKYQDKNSYLFLIQR